MGGKSRSQVDGVNGVDAAVLFGGTLFVVVGVTAYVAAVISGLIVHGHPAHDATLPLVGWAFVGVDTMVHATNPAGAWPHGSGVGPAVVLWPIFATMVAGEVAVARRIPWVRCHWLQRTSRIRGGARQQTGAGGMSAGEAKRHNERLGAL